MLDIDSKKLKSLRDNLKYFFTENLSYRLIILVFFTFLITLLANRLNLILADLFVFFLLFIFAFLILLDYHRIKLEEIDRIIQVIRSLRQNRFNEAYDIRLPDNLEELNNEIKELFKKNKDDLNRMQELEKLRSQFISNVSHELKTPLFAIQGFLETLKEGGIDDPNINQKYIEKALNNTYHLNHLITDLIELSKIESKEAKMNFKVFKLKDFLENVVYDLDIIAEEKGLKLILTPIKNNIEVYADIHRLRQVMYNLLSNAIKYTNEGKIIVSTEEIKDTVKITVKDTGIGIPQKDLPYIFQRFYRVDKDRSKMLGGTGLGLAIVKHILEAHNSKIEVKSVLGQGSEFSFYLRKY